MYYVRPYMAIDFYKTGHVLQFPQDLTRMYENFTPRSNRLAIAKGVHQDGVVVAGIQAFIAQWLVKAWNEEFFNKPKEEVINFYARRLNTSLGGGASEHLAALHDLGYLPLHIKALPEGSFCPIGVPVLTCVNTREDFGWLPGFFEDVISNSLWKIMTAATIAKHYREIVDRYALTTVGNVSFSEWQCHDFSLRGMSLSSDAASTGMGHLLFFTGSDNIPAIDFVEDHYSANADESLIAGSIPATEHSVMCAGGKESEYYTYLRILTEIYPNGMVSIVSDTWDYWKIITKTIPSLKDVIMAREGKFVVRPDSGNPVRIVAGYMPHEVVSNGDGTYYVVSEKKTITEAEYKGTVKCLYETFGGAINSKGYIELDPHIGVIYGDSITPERADQILFILAQKGFASNNVVFGIGSYTYQHITRDTFGFACKATYIERDGVGYKIFKDPATSDGSKKSAKGLLRVDLVDGSYVLKDQCTLAEEAGGELRTVFLDGVQHNIETFDTIRARAKMTLDTNS